MRVYRVGGSVRDELLGRPMVDRDFVVVGATPETLVARGFKPVGRDFPVFLHPETHEEYALARTERKTGRGYHGFVFHTSPDVTLEDDLARRDLTINAMARDEHGALIDPYGGARDLERGVLRHVSAAFAEDPLRVLRLARFASRFAFTVAPETEALARDVVQSGELSSLAAERVWQELSRALMESHPARFFAVLRRCGALVHVLPEVDALFGVPQPVAHHGELDAGVHVMQALELCAHEGDPLPVRYAVLAHDLGKATTPREEWPRHIAHEARSARLAARLSERLRAPAECRDLAILTAREHAIVHRIRELRPATVLELISRADGLRRPRRLHDLVRACRADALSRPGRGNETYAAETLLPEALGVVAAVDAGEIARTTDDSSRIALRVREARIAALERWKNARGSPGEP